MEKQLVYTIEMVENLFHQFIQYNTLTGGPIQILFIILFIYYTFQKCYKNLCLTWISHSIWDIIKWLEKLKGLVVNGTKKIIEVSKKYKKIIHSIFLVTVFGLLIIVDIVLNIKLVESDDIFILFKLNYSDFSDVYKLLQEGDPKLVALLIELTMMKVYTVYSLIDVIKKLYFKHKVKIKSLIIRTNNFKNTFGKE